MDGTLVPVGDGKVGASKPTYWLSANVQVIIDADTRLATARPSAVTGPTPTMGGTLACRGHILLRDGTYINKYPAHRTPAASSNPPCQPTLPRQPGPGKVATPLPSP